jgi:hypothetical protein
MRNKQIVGKRTFAPSIARPKLINKQRAYFDFSARPSVVYPFLGSPHADPATCSLN